MDPEEVDFLTCINCESPCYVFELDRKGEIVSAFCAVCGDDGPGKFRVPEMEEMEPDE